MKKDIFAVCDLEESYAFNLMDYLNGKKSTPFEIQAFTNIESLKNFTVDNEIEILLISTRAMCDEVRELPIRRIIMLSEGESLQALNEYPFVYKYQSSDQILSEVMEYYVTDNPKHRVISMNKKSAKLYAVYSPIGRSRKTLFALALGEVLAETSPALYLNFEPLSGFEQLFDVRYRMDLADLIYFARQKEGSLIYKLNSVVRRFHNLQYIPPALSPMDIRDVKGDEWLSLIHELSGFGDYETIILDVDEQMSDFVEILNICDRIFMPMQDDMISMAKFSQYEKLLGMLDMSDILERTVKVKPPLQMLQKDMGPLSQQLAWGEMGNYVRGLLGENG